jgi:hypothetical protein
VNYADPADAVWLRALKRLGWRLRRDDAVYASWDGVETLTICTPAEFDPDDCLAQMILHEIAHAIVAGPRNLSQPDWGMENVDTRDLVSEHACHRLQAHLLGRWGLRQVLNPTTDHRPYYDALPADPMAPGSDPAIALANDARLRAQQEPWASVLREALSTTAALAALVPADSGTIWDRAQPVHPTGLPGRGEGLCGDCAWRSTQGICLHAEAQVSAEQSACLRWEPPLRLEDCTSCGACCAGGFHRVELSAEEAGLPGVVTDDFGPHLPRPEGRCVHLEDSGLCAIYEERPGSCRDLEPNGPACREARWRVGLQGTPEETVSAGGRAS